MLPTNIFKQILEFFKNEKFLIVVLAIVAIFIAALTIESCSSLQNVSSFDSLKIYNYNKDFKTQL